MRGNGFLFITLLISFIQLGCSKVQNLQSDYWSGQGTITLKNLQGRMDHLAADVENHRLFLTGLENHSLHLIDIDSHKAKQVVSPILEPQGIAYIPWANRIIVACRGDGLCRSFDSQTFKEGPWIDVGKNSDNVRFDSVTQRVYVGSGAEPGPGLLAGIDLASLLPTSQGGVAAEPFSKADLLLDRSRQGEIKTQISLPSHPESFQIDPATQKIYVNVPDDHQIAVLSATNEGLKLETTWSVPSEKNFPMVLDSANKRLFVICRKPACVLVYDLTTGKVLSNTPCVGDSDDAYYDPTLNRLIVIGGEGFVDLFDASTNDLKPLDRLPTSPKARTGIYVPAWQTLIVAAPKISDAPAKLQVYKLKK